METYRAHAPKLLVRVEPPLLFPLVFKTIMIRLDSLKQGLLVIVRCEKRYYRKGLRPSVVRALFSEKLFL